MFSLNKARASKSLLANMATTTKLTTTTTAMETQKRKQSNAPVSFLQQLYIS